MHKQLEVIRQPKCAEIIRRNSSGYAVVAKLPFQLGEKGEPWDDYEILEQAKALVRANNAHFELLRLASFAISSFEDALAICETSSQKAIMQKELSRAKEVMATALGN